MNFLNCSWKWLNDEVVRRLTLTPKFTRASQKQWFLKLSKRSDYLIWGVEAGDTPIGACGLKNITVSDCEFFGYIGEKRYWGKGLGTEMMIILINKAKDLGKTSMWLKVTKTNKRALALYSKMGFSIVSEEKLLFVMRKYL